MSTHEGTKKAITDLNRLYKADPLYLKSNLVRMGLSGLIIQTIKMQLFRLYEKETK
jgi:hypothetical protein